MTIDWNTIGYCPWCGVERTVLAYDVLREQYEWAPCRTPRCRGGMITIVTDELGFIVHPVQVRGKYMLARDYKDTM